MSTATVASPAVTAFAAAVRTALSDLPAEEVDDLTDGLEAELTERIADGGVEDRELGNPLTYAEEVRVAAGLPSPSPKGRGTYWVRMPILIGTEWRGVVGRHPLLSHIGQFLVTLRPVWWIFRAAAVAGALLIIFGGYLFAPISGPFVLLFLALAVLSVQFGRGKWLPFAWMRGVLLVVNVLVAISVPFVLAGVATSINNIAYAAAGSNRGTSESSQTGLALNGSQLSNVFAYDAQGNPLSSVQLFDQDGKPLNLIVDPQATTSRAFYPGILVPNQSVPGRLGWNVYPLAHVTSGDVNVDGSLKQSAIVIPAVPPFATARPLAGSTPSPSPSSLPNGGAYAGAQASPTATPSPTPAP